MSETTTETSTSESTLNTSSSEASDTTSEPSLSSSDERAGASGEIEGGESSEASELSESGEVSEVLEALSGEELTTLETLLGRHKIGLKLDGEEKDFSFTELQKMAQKGYGADARFDEAATMRKESQAQQQVFETFLTALRDNPSAVLSQENMLGSKYREHIEGELTRQLQEEMLSPEEREQNAKLKEFDEMKAKLASQEQHAENARAKALEDQYATDYDNKITAALTTSGLPKTPQTVQRMAQLMQASLVKGIDADPSELVEIIKDEYKSDISTMLGGVSNDDLLGFLGDDVASKLRKVDLSRLKAPTHRNKTQASARPSLKKKGMSMDEFVARNKSIMESLA